MISSILKRAVMMLLSDYRLGQVKNSIQWGKGSLAVQTYPEGCSGALYIQCHNVRVIGNRFFRLFG
jgi:hypothetical protein